MKTSRQAKIRSIAVLITAALLLELTTAVQFMSTRKAISSQIMEMAQRDLSETNHTAEIKRIAEGAITDILPEVERLAELNQEDSLHRLLQKTVAIHPEIVGIDYTHRVLSDGVRNGYYTFRDEEHHKIADTIIGFDYTERTWYREGLHGNGFWSEPYMSRYYETLMSTFSRPVHNNKGEVTAVIGADVPMSELSALATQLYDNQQLVLYRVIIFQLLGLLVLAFIIYRSVTSVSRLNKVSAEKEFLNRELDIANRIQTSMLPTEKPERGDIEIAGTQVPAKQVGGDFYDYFVRNNKLFFNIGDVCGKGIPAALVMSMTQAVFRTVAAKEDNPATIVRDMNAIASRGNSTGMFSTLFVGVLDLETGKLHFCNAGHEKPLIIKGRVISQVETKANIPIGIAESSKYQDQETTIVPGDMIMLYTDGLNEATNAAEELFGFSRIASTINGSDSTQAATKAQKTFTPEELIETMKQSVAHFVQDAEQSDDLTMLAILYKGA